MANATPTLVVTEFLANPDGADDPYEWFEVYNASAGSINLRGYQFGSANEPGFTVGTDLMVAAGAYALFTRSPLGPVPAGVARFVYGAGVGSDKFILNNSNTDWITVKDPSGVLLDSLAYARRVAGTPGSYSSVNATARAKRAPVRDCSVAADATAWANATTVFGTRPDKGTPGGPNDVSAYTYEGSCEGAAARPLDAVTLPATLSVPQEGTVTLTSTATDAAGLAVAGGTVEWSADNENVTVTSTGARTASVRGDVIGTAVVTARLTIDGVTRTATTSVTITPKAAAGVASTVNVTNYPPTPLPIGFEFQLFATIKDGFGAEINDIDRNWVSNNPAVATVDQKTGVVRALGIGRAYIVAFPAEGVRDSSYVDVADVREASTAKYANHLEFGRPVDATPDDDYLVEWRQFSASWNRNRGQSNWVAYNLEATHRGPAERCDCFTADPSLPADFPTVVYTDYTGSGFSRGHMTMSEDRTAGGSPTTTSLDNARTFYMTNIIPQTAANNGGPWLRLETYLGDLAANANKEVFIIAGGAKYEGTLARSNGKVAIPTWTWKVAVVLPRDHGLGNVEDLGDAEIIAVTMPNTASMPSSDWQGYRVTVDSVESLTGYDLLALLPDPLEQIIESGDRAPSAQIVASGGTEGEVLTFDGTGSSDPDIGGALQDVLSYRWIVNGHVTGTGSTLSGSFPDDGTVQVRLVVTDRYGWADTASTSVQVTNVAPAVGAIGGATLLVGENYAASGSFTDPGSADTWTATVDYGDGTAVQPLALAGNAFTLAHRYAAAGTFTAIVTVTDDDGASGTRSASVTVHTSLQGIANLLPIAEALGVAGDLNAGTVQSLRAKLNAATASLRRGDGSAATGQLSAFINEIEALASSGRISTEAAASVADYANRVIRSIAP